MNADEPQFIKNPKTNRPLKVGSATWERLVKEGLLIDHGYNDGKTLYELKEGEDYEVAKKKVAKKLPMGMTAIKGKGRYEGKIVAQRTTPNTRDMVKKTASLASKTIIRNQAGLENCASQDELEERIEQLLLREMVMLPNKPKLSKKPPTPEPSEADEGDELSEEEDEDDEQ